MDIEGTYTLQALPEDVWHCLLDQQELRRTIPGVEGLEQVGENKYAVAMHIRHAPLIGSYHGHVTLIEQQYPYYYRMAIEGEGRQSTISGEGVVHLSGRGENTIVAYKGTLNLGKLGSLLPTPLVKGAAKLLIQQFFTALADQLRTMNPQEISTLQQPGGNIAVSSPTVQPTLLHTIVRLLRLGGGDPTREAQWVNRVRRAGVISALLLLVWIGTRLPRR